MPGFAAQQTPEETHLDGRLRLDVRMTPEDCSDVLHRATREGLTAAHREVPSVWLYDHVGSVLFDEITALPEYYLTRTERRLLQDVAGRIARRTGARVLVELGAGTSDKTRLLLDALESAGTLRRIVTLDVSAEMLLQSAHQLGERYPGTDLVAVVGDFERHLPAVPHGGPRLVTFLGSTVGNLDTARRAAFYEEVATSMDPGDAFLLGVDVTDDPDALHAAYNDAQGVTERFIRNALEVLNRRVGAEFSQSCFDYRAVWRPDAGFVDIGFVANRAHTVPVPGLDLEVPFRAGEPLRVEISTKFRRAQVEAELTRAGLRLDTWWQDPAGRFALVLARR